MSTSPFFLEIQEHPNLIPVACSSFLDSKDATSLEYKLDSFTSIYRRLTGKDVVFEFPVVPPPQAE